MSYILKYGVSLTLEQLLPASAVSDHISIDLREMSAHWISIANKESPSHPLRHM